MSRRVENMEIIGEWIPYEDETVRPCWRHNITGQITFRHPNYVGDCESCFKEINDINDCFIKSGDDGNSRYCKKCYDKTKVLDEMFITMCSELKEKERKKVLKEQKQNDKKCLMKILKSLK